MGLLERIFKPKKSEQERVEAGTYFKLLDGYRPVFHTWCGELYESSLVRAAIDARARHASKLQFQITGSARPELQTKVRHAPNDLQTWSQFLYRVSTILDMRNNCFIVPILGEFGEITGYYPICPVAWSLVLVGKTIWIRFKFADQQTSAIELDRVGILTRFQYRNDLFGESNTALDDTMQLIKLQHEGIQASVENSATYRFLAKVSNFTMAGDLSLERQRFDRENFQNGNGGGVLLFPNTYSEIQQVKQQSYSVDAEQMRLIEDNVFTYFGVNDEVLKNKAVGDTWAAFYEGAVEPFAIQLSDVMTRMTFTNREQSYGASIFFTSNRLQYLSNADKLNVSSAMLDRGIMSINEVRSIWNLEPVEGGDERIVRGEYYNANEKVSEQNETPVPLQNTEGSETPDTSEE